MEPDLSLGSRILREHYGIDNRIERFVGLESEVHEGCSSCPCLDENVHLRKPRTLLSAGDGRGWLAKLTTEKVSS